MPGKTDFVKLNEELAQKASVNKKERLDFLKIPYGDTKFGVLPPFVEGGELFYKVKLHFKVPENTGKAFTLKCSKPGYGECPICEKVAALAVNNKIEADELSAKDFYLYNVFTESLENRVASLKPSQHKELLQEIATYNQEQNIDPTDPNNGRIVKLTRIKVMPWARVRIQEKTVIVDAACAQRLLDSMTDLQTIYDSKSPEEIREIIYGVRGEK